MELTLGQKTNKELAEWMGISPKTFNNNKARQLEKLKFFAKFHLEDKKVVIDEVIEPIYDKERTRNCVQVGNLVPLLWNKSNLDTVTNLVDKVYDYYEENDPENKIAQLSPGTIRIYLGQGRNEFYGSPLRRDGGSLGSCCFRWCVEIEGGNNRYRDYRFFTPEEEEIKRRIYRKYFGDADDQLLNLRLAYKSGEISKDELADYIDHMDDDDNSKYLSFMDELREQIGGGVAHVTYRLNKNCVEFDDSSFFSIEDKKETQRAAGY